MIYKALKPIIVLLIFDLLATGCTSAPKRDYSLYRSAMPRSILVLPPLNNSTDVNAPYIFLSTITRPLANRGYYVFPVGIIDDYMKDNGLPTAYEMHNVPLNKLSKVFAADAVLYVEIEDWGQKYVVLSSSTVVKFHAKLVDLKSGEILWTGRQYAVESSRGQGIIGRAISAAVEQIVDTLVDRTYGLSRRANHALVFDKRDGLLPGYYELRRQSEIQRQ